MNLFKARQETKMLENYIRKKLVSKNIAIMAHIVCGFPSFKANLEILEEMEKAGVDVVEMQFPFSEPIADGPLFLMANQESLNSGTKVGDCFDFMEKVSENFSFKILMMGYYNTIFKYGENQFCKKLKSSGGVGFTYRHTYTHTYTHIHHSTERANWDEIN